MRVSVDLHQTYEAYREALRNQEKYAGGIAWKTVSGRDYLIKILNRRGSTNEHRGTSTGGRKITLAQMKM